MKIHEKCIGCQKIVSVGEESVCSVYRDPVMWWDKMGGCPLATHTHKIIQSQQEKTRLTIQKKKKTRK